MGFLLTFVAVVTIIVSIATLMIAYSFVMGDRLPKMRPSTYLKTAQGKRKKGPVILFAGDSHIQGNIGVGFYHLLKMKYQDSNLELINAGVNGDFAWNLLQRADEIILCKPDVVFILIGTNDALVNLSISHVGIAQRRKHLPQRSTLDWFQVIYRQLVHRLRDETSARIVLLTLPTIGENVGSKELQASAEYSSTIEDISTELEVSLLHIHNSMMRYLEKHPSRPTSEPKDAIRAMAVSMVRHFVFRKSWDSIADDTGQALHVDHIHLNSRGAQIVSDAIDSYLSALEF
jgi:lysophospholipase L1-like esterase